MPVYQIDISFEKLLETPKSVNAFIKEITNKLIPEEGAEYVGHFKIEVTDTVDEEEGY